jgi:Zn-dependent peptidase ImmA (M78 family)/transcriptional regulator with XRE-family HTH domain
MITNERQYRITKAQAAAFQRTLQDLGSTPTPQEIHPRIRKAQVDAVAAQLQELRDDLREYEHLREQKGAVLECHSFDELPNLLIKARVASGMNQRELAERLKLKEQQIQRYEATAYAGASVTRLLAIARALNVQFTGTATLEPFNATTATITARLRKIGLPDALIKHRLLPRNAAQEAHATKTTSARALGLLANVTRIYDWAPAALLTQERLTLDPRPLAAARFKLPANIQERSVAAYTIYAHYLARITASATTAPAHDLPTDPDTLHNAIRGSLAYPTLESTVRYAWSHGIPILPLADPGAFHAAVWRTDDRSVIVLKQGNRSPWRWLFDLLHELGHIAQGLADNATGIIESDDHPSMNNDREQAASQFAGRALLAGQAELLVHECVTQAQGNVEYLKAVVPRVAASANVPVGALANYLAYRLSLQQINWWGTAANLQRTDENAWQIVRDLFLDYADTRHLAPADQQLLAAALTTEVS